MGWYLQVGYKLGKNSRAISVNLPVFFNSVQCDICNYVWYILPKSEIRKVRVTNRDNLSVIGKVFKTNIRPVVTGQDECGMICSLWRKFGWKLSS